MATTSFQLDAYFTDIALLQWYHAARCGDLATVDIPSRGCTVELHCCAAGHVLWHTRGGQRSLTMPLVEALSRFQLFSYHPSPRGQSLDASPACVGAAMYARQ